jgi:aryl-alcohol dehydrogenase-like predicted oxidoreductase
MAFLVTGDVPRETSGNLVSAVHKLNDTAGSDARRQDRARRHLRDHVLCMDGPPIPAGAITERWIMGETPHKTAMMTDRRGFLGAATAIGAVAAASMQGSGLGVTSAAAQTAAPTSAAGPVLTRTIGRTGETVTALGLGTFLTFDMLPGGNREPLRAVTKTYLDAGVRVVDTSPLYGTGEVSLGTFMSGMGMTDQVFISNKIWSTGDYLADESHMLRSLEQSRLRLWRDKIDLLFCHSLVNVDVVMPTLRAWKKEGRVRYVGASVHENAYHDILAGLIERDMVDVVQVNYSIFNRGVEDRVLKAAQDKGVGVFINMPLEKGRLHKITEGRPLPDFAREIGAANWSQFFLKWVIGNPVVTTALPATSNPGHAAENVGALRGPLPDQAMRQRMVKHMETIPGFTTLASMAWYPDKGTMYQGVIRRSQASLRQRLS